MKVTVHGLLRTTLYSSTAGLLLGIPLVSLIPARLRGQEQPASPAVIRGQSPQSGGPLTRLFGNRTTASSPPNVAADLEDQGGTQATESAQTPAPPTRIQLRAQAKFMRRNPVAARMMMLQQQQQMLAEQQEALQEGYEAEAVPEPEVFDSLQIDADEWADAPGREITEQVPLDTNDKPWWQSGEKPANSRERRIIDEEPVADASTPAPSAPAPSPPTATAVAAPAPAPAVVVADPFPSEPNLAPAAAAPVPQRTAEAAPAAPVASVPPAAKDGGVEEWSLEFPEAEPAGKATVVAVPPQPAVITPPATALPAAPAAVAPPQPAPQFVPPEPAATTAAVTTPEPVVTTPASEPTFLPPEPEAPLANAAAPVTAATAVAPPTAPQAPTAELPLPAAPSTLLPPSAPEQVVTTEPQAFPAVTEPAPAPFIPTEPAPEAAAPAPAVVAEQPAEAIEHPGPAAPETPFTGLTLDAPPAVPLLPPVAPPGEPVTMPAEEPQPTADEFLPPKPLDPTESDLLDAPAGPGFVSESAAPPTTEVIELPPEPAPADALPAAPIAVPGLSQYLLDEPSLPAAPAATPVPQFTPQDLQGGRTGAGTLELPNPAPFIPPAPEDFGAQLETPAQDYYVPGAALEPGLGDALSPAAPPAPEAPEAELAPDVTTWAPEPLPAGPDTLQIPDPIVAPSTAKRLEAPTAPTPQQTNSKIERIASRKGLNGFKGFCPVAIKDHRELIDARPEYSAVYNGRRYFFSSAASQALFEADPENYAPAALGNDVVHLMLTGESRAGSLEHAVWFRSKLYMFATVETMETFVASPSIHAWEE